MLAWNLYSDCIPFSKTNVKPWEEGTKERDKPVSNNNSVFYYCPLAGFKCPPYGKLAWAGGVYSKAGASRRNLYNSLYGWTESPRPRIAKGDRISFKVPHPHRPRLTLLLIFRKKSRIIKKESQSQKKKYP